MTNLRKPAPAGDYDQRIAIQDRGTAANGLGENVPAWSTVAKVWAKIRPVRGDAYFAAGQLQTEVDHVISFRYGVAVTVEHRVLWLARGTAFEIVSIIEPSAAKSDTELMCKTGVLDGR